MVCVCVCECVRKKKDISCVSDSGKEDSPNNPDVSGWCVCVDVCVCKKRTSYSWCLRKRNCYACA